MSSPSATLLTTVDGRTFSDKIVSLLLFVLRVSFSNDEARNNGYVLIESVGVRKSPDSIDFEIPYRFDQPSVPANISAIEPKNPSGKP